MSAAVEHRAPPRLPSPRIFAALVAAVYAIDLTLLHTPRGAGSLTVAVAAAIDFTVVVPLLFWWLVLRPAKRPWLRALPVFIASVVVARLSLPPRVAHALTLERFAGAPLEIAVLWWAIVRVRSSSRAMHAAGAELDLPERLSAALREGFPYGAVAEIMATEFSIGFYALASWRRAPHVPSGAAPFTYHRRTGIVASLGAIALAATVETIAVHALLHRSHPRAAWTLFAISVFSVLWLVGLIRSIVLRPVIVTNDALLARCGVRWNAAIPWSQISSVESGWRIVAPPKRARDSVRLMPVAQPNVLVRLAEPAVLRGMYGSSRTVNTIALAVDDAPSLHAAIAAHLSPDKPDI